MDYLCSRNSVVALPVVLNLGLCVPCKGLAIDLHAQLCFTGQGRHLIERELVGKE